jgi:hypothetical protein
MGQSLRRLRRNQQAITVEGGQKREEGGEQQQKSTPAAAPQAGSAGSSGGDGSPRKALAEKGNQQKKVNQFAQEEMTRGQGPSNEEGKFWGTESSRQSMTLYPSGGGG